MIANHILVVEPELEDDECDDFSPKKRDLGHVDGYYSDVYNIYVCNILFTRIIITYIRYENESKKRRWK